ncbi:hypothetical protein B0A49_02811 [Cryomyces minteri]|uniref:Uncharacterized protein n=1 Tax=Cryomyces minteri TaxID=331657 RepID=A0A4U0X2P9_9PEZI|nr:hypothetical protein B0A49_11279 [Cryomyces minteri]TKA70590.1 hypothetical protein B0A49_02811 [Cryomyces minteri]
MPAPLYHHQILSQPSLGNNIKDTNTKPNTKTNSHAPAPTTTTNPRAVHRPFNANEQLQRIPATVPLRRRLDIVVWLRESVIIQARMELLWGQECDDADDVVDGTTYDPAAPRTDEGEDEAYDSDVEERELDIYFWSCESVVIQARMERLWGQKPDESVAAGARYNTAALRMDGEGGNEYDRDEEYDKDEEERVDDEWRGREMRVHVGPWTEVEEWRKRVEHKLAQGEEWSEAETAVGGEGEGRVKRWYHVVEKGCACERAQGCNEVEDIETAVGCGKLATARTRGMI